MQSFLLVAKNSEKRSDYIASFQKEKQISPFDVITVTTNEETIGIEEIRNMQKIAYLSPQKGKEKLIVIDNADLLTTEAQNALLKLVEEPPLHTMIILSATTSTSLLPTILSRCSIIVLEDTKVQLLDGERKEKEEELHILQTGAVGEKLILAEKLAAEKLGMTTWFEKMSFLLREKMIHDTTSYVYPHILKALLETKKTCDTTNVSPRILLEHFFLSIGE